MKKRLLSILILLSLVLLLPGSAFGEGLPDLWEEDLIWFGEYEGEPVAWLVLDAAQTNMGTEGVFLISEGLFDINEVVYDEDSTLWEGSLGQQWCTDFAAAAFTPAESALVPLTYVDEEETLLYALSWREVSLRGEQVFFLSVIEVDRYWGSYSPDYMYTVKPISLESYWWLRSPHRYHEDYHGIVLHSNMIHDYLPFAPWCARPCINLTPDAALFLLPADDEGAPGAVVIPTDGERHEWKLLAELPEHPFRAGTTAADAQTLTVSYSGADTDEDAMLSVLIRSAEGEPLSLRRLERPASPEGTLSLDLVQLALPEGAELFLLCEKFSPAHYTNYAGTPQPLVTELPPEPEPTPEAPEETPEPESTALPETQSGKSPLLPALLAAAGLLAVAFLVLTARRRSSRPVLLLLLLLALAAVVWFRVRVSGAPALFR